MEAEEEQHDDDQFDQPNQSQLDHDATTSKNLRMDGSSSGSESGGWRREGGGRVGVGARGGHALPYAQYLELGITAKLTFYNLSRRSHFVYPIIQL